MARSRRTTIVIPVEDERALEQASRAEGVSQSELVRRGIRIVTAPYRRHTRPSVGWLSLTSKERKAVLDDRFGDADA